MPPSRNSGFSLLQTSIILMMAGLVLSSLLPGQGAGDTNQKILETIARLNKVEDGMQRFMALQGRRPCPADGQYDVNHANFGVEAGATVANSPLGSCVGGTPAASMGPDAGTGLVVAGMIPTKTLALPDDYAFDAWGRRFNYVVDIRATTIETCFALKTGSIQVRTKDPTGATVFTDNVMYTYLSHGPGGYGAWPAQGLGPRLIKPACLPGGTPNGAAATTVALRLEALPHPHCSSGTCVPTRRAEPVRF
jgi:hypothetical protein